MFEKADPVTGVRLTGFLDWSVVERGGPASQWCPVIVRVSNVLPPRSPLPGDRLYPAREDGVS